MEEKKPEPNISGPDKPKEGKEKIDLRILVADDNKDIREVLKFMLSMKYTSIESVEDGELLVDKLSKPDHNFDFIITDNSMPNLTGIEAIGKIRAMEHLKNIPIIIYTTDTGSTKEEAEAMGAFFLPKPAKPEVLYAAIESLRQKK